MKKITLNTFRKMDVAEEIMIRVVMPTTSARDLAPLVPHFLPARSETVARRAGSRLVRPLTFTLAEVAHV